MAEDDDDESFGDFAFASFPNQQPLFPSTSISISSTTANANNDDDDWGDFVNHSSTAQINGGFAKPYDPLGASLRDPNPDRSSSHVNDNNSNSSSIENGVVVQPPAWKKPQGAIPLSIFGEEEEEEKKEQEHSAVVFSNGNNDGDYAKKGSKSNGSVGINDLFSSLYNQSNGSVSKSGVFADSAAAAAASASNLNSNGISNLNSDSVDGDEDDDGWEFQSAEWETGTKNQNAKAEVPKHENGALGVGAKLDLSNGISDNAGGWNLGFEFSPSIASQDHTSPRLGRKSEFNEPKAGFATFNQNFGELKGAHSWPGSNQNMDAPNMADEFPASVEVLKFDDGASNGTFGPSLASKSYQADEWAFSFSFNSSSPGKDSHISEYFKTKSNQDDNNRSNASPTNMNFDSNVNLFESKGADIEIGNQCNQDDNNKSNASPTNTNVDSNDNLFESKAPDIEIGTKNEKPQTSLENHREALPLSIFGDEMPDTEEHSLSQDLSTYAPTSPIRNNFSSPGSTLSINDIWNLYTSPNVTPKASENVTNASPGVSTSDLATGDDDFEDDFWDYKDASPGTTFVYESAQKSSFDQASQVNENGLHSSPTVLNSDSINDDDGFEDDSWEFKDATSGTRSQDLTSTIDYRDLPMQSSAKLEPLDYVYFYSKLKDELCNAVLFHLQNLKKAQRVAALSGEDAKEKALQEEIQEFSKIMHQDNIIPSEHLSENYSPRNVHFDELLELLKESRFQSLESEYRLSPKLLMAKKDMKSAMEFLKDAESTLRILKLGSREDQSNYLATWSKIAFACSQELNHGANIWKQAVQKNVHDQILSNPKGVRYILALGEIYRVAEIIGASSKFYMPWMLLGSIDPTSLCALLNECYSIWLSSGLDDALIRISNLNNFEQECISRELVESIKYIHELDEHALQSYVISGEETTCQLSALTAGFIPGLKMVAWNGKHYFVTLANLWINLISSDPPKK